MKTLSRILFVLLLAVLASLFLSCSNKEKNGGGGGTRFPWYFFPADNEISGWVKVGASENVDATPELWDLIDGEAQVYIDCGFSSCGRQVYQGSIAGSPVEIRYFYIYDQGSDSNAALLYNDARSGTGSPWTDDPAGAAARINDYGLDSYTIDFYQSKYFAKLTILKKNAEALAIAKIFCHNVSNEISGTLTTTRLPSGE
jgi:hypothetical protein